jgi:hypothetical protein
MPDNSYVIDMEITNDTPAIGMEVGNSARTVDMTVEPGSDGWKNIIDDTAGAGVTNKAWSADKLTEMFDGVSAGLAATLISGNKYRMGGD